ncbi:heterokaryon incompatibility protein-domain-containing protein, partial [Schizothecium vesticola]
QIRLLELLPGKATDTVQANLFIVESPRHHEYEALSYTWGRQTIQHTITLNGQPYPVGTNLHDALVSLRLPGRVRHLWVDAVCINQKDDDEKTVQIGLMGAIYCEARNVAIFLGMPTAKSEALFEFI